MRELRSSWVYIIITIGLFACSTKASLEHKALNSESNNGPLFQEVNGTSFNSQLPKCLNDIITDLSKLPTEAGNVLFKNFENNKDSLFRLVFTNETLPASTPASVSLANVPPHNAVVITVDMQQLQEASNLAFASLVLNQVVQAFYIAQMQSNYMVAMLANPNIDKHLPTNKKGYKLALLNTVAQNNHIANSNLLFKYAQSKGLNVPIQYCQQLMWAGLTNTEAFLKLPVAQQKEAMNTILTEFRMDSASAGAKGSSVKCQ